MRELPLASRWLAVTPKGRAGQRRRARSSVLLGDPDSNLKSCRPNLITFTGFLINLIPILMLLLNNDYGVDGETNQQLCFMIGVTYTIYIILDNCDGK